MAPAPDRDSQPWWDALARRELRIQECRECHRRRWPLRDKCAHCGGTTSDLVQAQGTGTVATWATVWRSPDPRLPVPYVVVLVRLDDDENILMPGWIDGPQDGSDLSIGMLVAVDFVVVQAGPDAQQFNLLRWRPGTKGGEER